MLHIWYSEPGHITFVEFLGLLGHHSVHLRHLAHSSAHLHNLEFDRPAETSIFIRKMRRVGLAGLQGTYVSGSSSRRPASAIWSSWGCGPWGIWTFFGAGAGAAKLVFDDAWADFFGGERGGFPISFEAAARDERPGAGFLPRLPALPFAVRLKFCGVGEEREGRASTGDG